MVDMTSNNTSDFSSCNKLAPTNPNLNTKENLKYLQAWLAGETNLGRFLYDCNSRDIAVAEAPNSRPLQPINHQSLTPVTFPPPCLTVSKSTGSSSSSPQTFWSCHHTSESSKQDSPPQLPLVHAPDTTTPPHTPAELPLVGHTYRQDGSCQWDDAPRFSDFALQLPASQDGFCFKSDPYNPSRIRLPQSPIPLSQLQVAGHCPTIIDEIYDRFPHEKVSLL